MDKEKLVQIYEAMANITLTTLKLFESNSGNSKGKSVVILDNDLLEMVRTTQFLYETINHANQLVIPIASVRDVSNNLENDCKYTYRPDVG